MWWGVNKEEQTRMSGGAYNNIGSVGVSEMVEVTRNVRCVCLKWWIRGAIDSDNVNNTKSPLGGF